MIEELVGAVLPHIAESPKPTGPAISEAMVNYALNIR